MTTATARVVKHRAGLPAKRWELSPPPHLDDRPAIKAYAAKLARKRAKLAGRMPANFEANRPDTATQEKR